MYQSDIKTSGHVWSKQNLVTLNRRGKMFDEMLCENCGMKGRRYGFVSVEVSESYKLENVRLCPKAKPTEVPQRVKVIKCNAQGGAFSNITPDSVHKVITAPIGHNNDRYGVWVMGNGEPVKLLINEFTNY